MKNRCSSCRCLNPRNYAEICSLLLAVTVRKRQNLTKNLKFRSKQRFFVPLSDTHSAELSLVVPF